MMGMLQLSACTPLIGRQTDTCNQSRETSMLQVTDCAPLIGRAKSSDRIGPVRTVAGIGLHTVG